MPRAVLLGPVVLLAAGAAWSQGGAGGGSAAALGSSMDVAPLRAPSPVQEPLTLCAAPQAARPRAARPPSGAATPAAEAATPDSADASAPPDPVERGACTLVVSLTDEAGQPLDRVEVQLWRLDAPANEHWSAGDRLQAEGRSVQGRVEWNDLPAGRYRVFSLDRRASGDDPGAFSVGEPSTAITLALSLPREVPVLVHVVDENGAPLTQARWGLGSESQHPSLTPPDWAVPRTRRNPPAMRIKVWARGYGTTASGGGRGTEIRATAEGFALGVCTERMVRRRRWVDEGLRFEGRSSVGVRVASDDARTPGALRYVAVSVPLESLSAYVWTPDGRLAREAGATFHATCAGVHVPEGTVPPNPRELPIHVSVSLPGHATLAYTTRLCERPVDRTLARAESPEVRTR